MTEDEILAAIPGAAALRARLGRFPSFHDHEILSLALDRRGPAARMVVHSWRTEPRTDERGFYILSAHTRVTIDFEGVGEISLSGFNHQNVIGRILWTRHPGGLLKAEIDGIFGAGGHIAARSVAISIEEATENGEPLTS